jgi:carboxypeptidase PM20D1
MTLALNLVVVIIVAIALWMLAGACMHRPKELPEESATIRHSSEIEVNMDRAARSLSEAIKVQTVSYADLSQVNHAEFQRFHALLESLFPLVHRELEKTALDHNLVYRWKGEDSSKKAIALMSHMDVVPADEEGWKHPPFRGAIEDGYIWGRGALDIKYGLIGILEAVEHLLETGYVPSRDIYVISTADEEVGGKAGITAVANHLRESNVSLEWVLDEGGVVGDGLLAGLDTPVALVGVAEKGYVDVEMSVEMEGGHSSYPGKDTTIGVLCEAVKKVEKSQMAARLGSPVREFLDELSRHMGFGARLVFANSHLLEPIIMKQLLRNAQTAALVRTTVAPTVISGGSKTNVMPPKASAVINCRLLPGDTTQDVMDHIAAAVDDRRVKLTVLTESPASGISSPDSRGFRLIRDCIRRQFPEAVTTPYLVIGGTDAKALEPLAEGVYRFTPVQVGKDDLAGMHGVNERVSVDNLEKAVKFFAGIIMNA